MKFRVLFWIFVFFIMASSCYALLLEAGVRLSPSLSNTNCTFNSDLNVTNITVNQTTIFIDGKTMTFMSNGTEIIVYKLGQNMTAWKESNGNITSRKFCMFEPNSNISLIKDLMVIDNYISDSNGCVLSNIVLEQNELYVLMPENSKSIIPEYNGTPFYTMNSNPYQCSNLSYGESCTLTWSVNATGEENTFLFFALAQTGNTVPAKSDEVNISIFDPLADHDGDGFAWLDDCNDSNPDMFPAYDGLVVDRDITLCHGNYSLNDQDGDGIFIIINASSASLDCNNAELHGTGNGTAIFVKGELDWNQILVDTQNLTYFVPFLDFESADDYLDDIITNATLIDNIVVENCRIFNTTTAINITAGRDITIRNNEILYSEKGILGMLAVDSTIEANTISYASGPSQLQGAIVALARNTDIKNNLIDHSSAGVGVIGILNNLYLNDIADGQIGIALAGYLNDVYNNTANNNEQSGIIMAFSQNNSIHDNTAGSNAESGLTVFESSNNRIADNEFNNNKKGIYFAGLFTQGPTLNNIVEGNTILGSTQAGIELSDWTFIAGLKRLFKLIAAQFGGKLSGTAEPLHRVINNTFIENYISSADSIFDFAVSHNANVKDNIIYSNIFHGAGVDDTAKYNIYCVNDIGNEYLGEAEGPTCSEYNGCNLDDCESIDSWNTYQATAPTLDIIIRNNASASINMGKDSTTSNTFWYEKTVDSFDGTDDYLYVWIYVNNMSYLKDTNTAVEIGPGDNGGNRWLSKSYTKSQIAEGWNLIGGKINEFTDNGGPDITSLDYIYVEFWVNNNSVQIPHGELKMDCWHLTDDSHSVECSLDSECGENEIINTFCSGNESFQTLRDYSCSLPGTPGSSCIFDDLNQSIEICDYGCMDGSCLPDPCFNVTCDDYCDNLTWYSVGACAGGSCNYTIIEENSTQCT
ncbi:right-handed parallel beta-helix repeat-containing protein [Thermoproteota archaeon]